jgi:hypothetical protein
MPDEYYDEVAPFSLADFDKVVGAVYEPVIRENALHLVDGVLFSLTMTLSERSELREWVQTASIRDVAEWLAGPLHEEN